MDWKSEKIYIYYERLRVVADDPIAGDLHLRCEAERKRNENKLFVAIIL